MATLLETDTSDNIIFDELEPTFVFGAFK